MKKVVTKEEFEARAMLVHGKKFTFPGGDEWANMSTPIKMCCSQHGRFTRTPASFLSSISGCPKCAKMHRMIRPHMTHEEFVNRARAVHGDRYTYPNRIKSVSDKMYIECELHGTFVATAHTHIFNKIGCKKCGPICKEPQIGTSVDNG